MTLAVKLLLIGALVLGIVIPFGYFLLGEKTKKRYKRAIGANAFFYFSALIKCMRFLYLNKIKIFKILHR